MADVIVYTGFLQGQGTYLDEQADKVRDYHASWRTSTAYTGMGSALPNQETHHQWEETVDVFDRRLTALESALRAWARQFRAAAVVYADADFASAGVIDGSAP